MYLFLEVGQRQPACLSSKSLFNRRQPAFAFTVDSMIEGPQPFRTQSRYNSVKNNATWSGLAGMVTIFALDSAQERQDSQLEEYLELVEVALADTCNWIRSLDRLSRC